MSTQYHVNGTATLSVAGYGFTGVLGITSAEGVTISLTAHYQEIYSDESGPNIPSEVLMNGQTAEINFDLWKYDAVVLSGLLANRTINTIGKPMFMNNRYFNLTIASPVDNSPWYFPRCWVPEGVDVTLSTQLKHWVAKIRAVPDDNGILYTHG